MICEIRFVSGGSFFCAGEVFYSCLDPSHHNFFHLSLFTLGGYFLIRLPLDRGAGWRVFSHKSLYY